MWRKKIGKRSDFERKPRDFYPTPYKAVIPLLPHLRPNVRYAEPCAGDGVLIDHLKQHDHECLFASDIKPARYDIMKMDYKDIDRYIDGENVECIITNPPWSRPSRHDRSEKFSDQKDTWLLFDSDWAHTMQAIPYMDRCLKIVSVGRVKWFDDTTGKDNCAWYQFGRPKPINITKFYGRLPKDVSETHWPEPI